MLICFYYWSRIVKDKKSGTIFFFFWRHSKAKWIDREVVKMWKKKTPFSDECMHICHYYYYYYYFAKRDWLINYLPTTTTAE